MCEFDKCAALAVASLISLSGITGDEKCPVGRNSRGRENVGWSISQSFDPTDGNRNLSRGARSRPQRPLPRAALLQRFADEADVIGIVHWGLNTYTDREWGFGDEDPKKLNPSSFDAEQIVNACAAGGIRGLVIVAKHHDGFCLWPTKTTEHNITRSPFRGGKGDYVREMERACRKAGLRFGVYCSPWDRNSVHYGSQKYVEIYHAQLRELLGGDYGEVFEMWFDNANGGDGWYGGAKEKRKIPSGYYRFDEIFRFVRELQPQVCIFNEDDGADFRWPGNEKGDVVPESRATGGHFDLAKYDDYLKWANSGLKDGSTFHPVEADFPLRPGWFYHAKDRGRTKSSIYLMNRYLQSVGNAGTMDLGIAPNRDGVLDAEDVRALKCFGQIRKAFFSKRVAPTEPFNVVVMREDISRGERVDSWQLLADGKAILSGESIGAKRIRVLDKPLAGAKEVVLSTNLTEGPKPTFACYFVNPELAHAVLTATSASGETDTAKWMMKDRKSNR